MGKLSGGTAKTVESIIGGANPDYALAIFDNPPDFIAAEAVGIIRIVLVVSKLTSVVVPLADPRLSGYP